MLLSSDQRDADAAFELDGLTLAYMGDAVYEILVRDYLLRCHRAKPGALHRMATEMVAAGAQFEAYKRIAPLLNEREQAVFTRGRNSKTSVKKQSNPIVHCHATGLEALFGYLYLAGEEERLRALFAAVVAPPEEKCT